RGFFALRGSHRRGRDLPFTPSVSFSTFVRFWKTRARLPKCRDPLRFVTNLATALRHFRRRLGTDLSARNSDLGIRSNSFCTSAQDLPGPPTGHVVGAALRKRGTRMRYLRSRGIRWSALLLVACLVVAGHPTAARAVNLITNGDFEIFVPSNSTGGG